MSVFIPGEKPSQVSQEAWDFTQARNVDLVGDLLCSPDWMAKLMKIDGGAEHHVRKPGVEYSTAQVNYFDRNRLVASRVITRIEPGKGNEISHWSSYGPDRLITIHKGIGNIILGYPEKPQAEVQPINEHYLTEFTLRGGTVYTVEALGRFPLIVSELWRNPDPIEMRRYRTVCAPGAETIATPDGHIEIPVGFPEAPRD